MTRYVVVGNGVAGHRAAIELRRRAPEAEVTLIGMDAGLPYDRTTLTKDYLLGQKSAEEIVFKDARLYDGEGIAYRPETWVEGIDRAARRVFGAGLEVPYDRLLLATGSRPRRLPRTLDAGAGFYVRTLADIRPLAEALVAGRHVAVIGGGFIGLEVAAAARQRGCVVTVIEARPNVLSRGMVPFVGAFMRTLHEGKGVEIRCGEMVEAIEWSAKGATLKLTHGSLDADIVVYGLGVEPNVELAAAIGLLVDDGIVVDAQCRTDDAAIFAAGEVTSHPSGPLGQRRRIESWRLCSQQPLTAAANMAGERESYRETAWLWSDQFDVNLQALGEMPEGANFLLRGSRAEKRWTLMALNEAGLPVGAVAANNGRDISMLRRAIDAGQPLPAALAKDSRPFHPHEPEACDT